MAFLGLDYAKAAAGTVHPPLLPFVVAALPLLDAIRVVIQRVAQRRSIFEGSRNHFYDLLLARGEGPHKVAFISWAVGLICGAIGVSAVYLHLSQAWSLISIVLAAAWTASLVSAPKTRSQTLSKKNSLSISN